MVEPPQASPKRVISFVLADGFALLISASLIRGGYANILPIAPDMELSGPIPVKRHEGRCGRS